ncbi:MAG: glycosyltransferase [Wenzhouxiangella sp.]
MRIALMIGGLGRGGAERQLIRLALGLQRERYLVEVWCYTSGSELDESLRAKGINVRSPELGEARSKRGRVRAWLKEFKPDVVHCFMKRASNLGVLARGFASRPVVVGSDLSTATYGKRDYALFSSLVLFGLCDVVATQTELNRRSLQRLAPWLRGTGKVRVVRNGLDLARFEPADQPLVSPPLRFAAVGSVYAVKNPVRLVQAMVRLRELGYQDARLDWYGRLGLKGDSFPSEDYFRCKQLIEEYQLADCVKFHGETADVAGALRRSHVLIHPSVQEGFPNAVVEGMACALPVVVSRVSDLPLVVETARNGYVFDETSVEAIASAMVAMLDTAPHERQAMGQRSRALVESWFGLERFVNEYADLYRELVARRNR